ncbi:helix-turn-helix transcriptional regulator [Mycobacterium sp. KBS0706]|uniref:ArsR/SmtB family transcription factor n=1 Tax=Mycobacterium sp. KBS0706 TaxID=2578109 RepID=UPI00110FBDA7|nr:metalloregulator ArsR/SmtB family transcription factor [Mycobacterium sp. KBS0706]TSD84287.1 helix-turn-helix transcriptional regulator [Mycobacterium sp. KBS0706]
MDEIAVIEGLGALAQSTRLAVFRLLVQAGPDGVPAGTVAERVGVPSTTLSTHLGILSRAGLIRSQREGRSILYSADLDGVRALLSFLVQDCCSGRPEICAPLMDVIEQAGCGCQPAAQAQGEPAAP